MPAKERYKLSAKIRLRVLIQELPVALKIDRQTAEELVLEVVEELYQEARDDLPRDTPEPTCPLIEDAEQPPTPRVRKVPHKAVDLSRLRELVTDMYRAERIRDQPLPMGRGAMWCLEDDAKRIATISKQIVDEAKKLVGTTTTTVDKVES